MDRDFSLILLIFRALVAESTEICPISGKFCGFKCIFHYTITLF